MIFLILFQVIYQFRHNGRSLFFCTLSFLNSISEPNNQVFVLGVINERYKALCNVCMSVYMCLKVSVIYGQSVKKKSFFFIKEEWVNMGLKILNLEGRKYCTIGSKATVILLLFSLIFIFSIKNFKRRHIQGVYPEAIDWDIALHTQIVFWVRFEVRFRKTLLEPKSL